MRPRDESRFRGKRFILEAQTIQRIFDIFLCALCASAVQSSFSHACPSPIIAH